MEVVATGLIIITVTAVKSIITTHGRLHTTTEEDIRPMDRHRVTEATRPTVLRTVVATIRQ